ncbi:MAG: hypothetical protein Q7R39_04500 [Dehalococcoidia bacterium]|nr:hypothetical protein [Dehalococcoidia bacterium]
MNVMRYTIVDGQGAISFVDHCDVLDALVAACGGNPRTVSELLDLAGNYYGSLKEFVLCGLAVFDEHNTPGQAERIHRALDFLRPEETPVFRVLDEITRQASLQPVKAGIIIFNLTGKRIVQVMNNYVEIRREGRGRVHDEERPTGQLYRYRLPGDWALVP